MSMVKRLLAAAGAAAMLAGIYAAPAGEMLSASAAATPRFVVSNAEVPHGGTVSVTVSIENNPGISAFRLKAGYDSSVMSLRSAEGGTLTKGDAVSSDVFVGSTAKNPLSFSWLDGMNGDYTYNGTVLTLTFDVSSDAAAGSYPVTLSYDPEDVFNSEYDNVTFAAAAGTVRVTHAYTDKIVPPTCTEKGYTLHTCSVCKDSYTDTETAALGHSYTSKVTKKASCTEPGIMTYTCSRCTDTYTAEIKPTGHFYISEVIAPTEAEGGYTLHTCSNCGDSYKDGFTDPLSAPLQGRITLLCEEPDTAGLTVTAEDGDGNTVSAVVSSGGSYFFSELGAGTWTVRARKDMFVPEVQPVILSDKPTEMNFTLCLYGDCDGNGTVNMKDITTLQKKINQWDVTFIEKAADLNGDGSINMKDLTMLQRFINGWKTEFGK